MEDNECATRFVYVQACRNSIPRAPPPIGAIARVSGVCRESVEVGGYLAWLGQRTGAAGAPAGGGDPMRSTTIGAIDMGLAKIANDLRATADGTAVVTGPQYLILNTVKTGDPSEGRGIGSRSSTSWSPAAARACE